jgi:hypothetical protein
MFSRKTALYVKENIGNFFMIVHNYCTLFDSKYLNRGLAMYESLKTYDKNFHLYIFAFDEFTEKMLKELNLSEVTVISLGEFEDNELLSVKQSRTKVEYYWTCTASTIKYCIEKFNLDSCTYVDADIYFYGNPSVLLEEMGNNSVLITPHWYTPVYDESERSGIYCVQFVSFRNTIQGMDVLNWWRKECINWCYARFENGKFGDQKYLDNWPEKFKGVYVLKNRGGGVAPWNVQQYDLKNAPEFIIKEKKTGKSFPLIFYHYHYLRFLLSRDMDLGPYVLSHSVIEKLYIPYILNLTKINRNLEQRGYKKDLYVEVLPKNNWKTYVRKNIAKINILVYFFFYLFNKLPCKFWRNSRNNSLNLLKKILVLLIIPDNIVRFTEKK